MSFMKLKTKFSTAYIIGNNFKYNFSLTYDLLNLTTPSPKQNVYKMQYLFRERSGFLRSNNENGDAIVSCGICKRLLLVMKWWKSIQQRYFSKDIFDKGISKLRNSRMCHTRVDSPPPWHAPRRTVVKAMIDIDYCDRAWELLIKEQVRQTDRRTVFAKTPVNIKFVL